MSDTAIRVCALSKRYRLGQREPYKTLRDALSRAASAPVRHARSAIQRANGHPTEDATKSIWALRDVSFEVKKGEVVGIIGGNGSGKSTLLKILARITEPTKGYAEFHGRVGALLEVGTGFHPELTGRENILLSGAVLGMSRKEIGRKFDEIVAFSEVERFLDTPVKRYSSGMYLRLAFAVAAHLEPEILLVDEVLAVGDAAFQKKCLAKMGDGAREGRTTLFVSHNMGAIEDLCQTTILLTEGRPQRFESASKGVAAYLGGRSATGTAEVTPVDFSGPLRERLEFRTLRVAGADEQPSSVLSPSDPVYLKTNLLVHSFVPVFRTSFSIFSKGLRLFTLHDTAEGEDLYPGEYEAMVSVPSYFLRPGEYSVALGGYCGGVTDEMWIWGRDLLYFHIAERWDERSRPSELGLVNAPRSRSHRTLLETGAGTHEQRPDEWRK